VLDVARTLARAYGVECRYRISGDFRAGDIRHGFADTTRLRDALGLEPRYGFEEGIRQFAAWVVEHRAALESSGTRYNASIEEMRAKGLLGRSLVNS
jgi:dTDP-L-rhamnose 4-epimerase